MGKRLGSLGLLAIVVGVIGAGGCAAGPNKSAQGGGGEGNGGTGGDTSTGATGPGGDGGGGTSTTTNSGATGSGGIINTGDPPPEGEVFGHSDKTLFKLEPISKKVTIVGNFDCINIQLPGSGEGMWDIALDKDGNMMGTAAMLEGFNISGALVTIDKLTAHCVIVAKGQYPNSLTFLPAGTLDPNVEALVGFVGETYVRIDTATGQQTNIGALNPNDTGSSWESSGDVVSIIDDKTYLTVKPLGSGSGFAGTDNIIEIDPVTGKALKVIGDTTYPKLWGLGYWGGTAYGFSATGQLCAIDLTNGMTSGIPLMDQPAGLAFWGAGVTTSAPIEVPK